MCQDLQATSFLDCSFDIIITEYVLEHIPDPLKAFEEIKRILKIGGFHFATIPVDWGNPSRARAVIEDGETRHLMEPEYHGDPILSEGILEFTEFGFDLSEKYCSLIGKTDVYWANDDKLLEDIFVIYINWVFVSQKQGI